ncbi:MAG: hypothetical protein ACREQ5_21515, partial [Candidatus Dormibacteria bacterium]
AVAQLAASDVSPTAPDFGRRRGNPGGAKTAPVAKVALTEADSGKTIVVKPGTEIDVTLKPDSGKRWSPPRSNNPRSVSRNGGRQGFGWGGPGKRQGTPDFGPGQGRQGSSGTQATFVAHQDGDATLSSAERGGGFMFPPGRSSSPAKSWSVKVTVSGPAPAAPKPQPKPGPPGTGIPGLPGAPGSKPAPPAAVTRDLAPVNAAVQKLTVSLPRL